jgi:hypothetical protein
VTAVLLDKRHQQAVHMPCGDLAICTAAVLQVLAQLGTEGVLVLEVPAGTPAAAAGLRPTYRDVFGDIVLGGWVGGWVGVVLLCTSILHY